MKKNVLLIFLLLYIFIPITAKNRCLLIGVGNYPDGSGWRTINSVNDVNLLEQILSKTFSVSKLIDENATHDAIIETITSLTGEVQSGDTILIHFSCHGQQMLTHQKDEPDDLNESLIPYDALSTKTKSYFGQNHLVDDEVNELVHSLRLKVGTHGLVIVTLDACFSDSMNKGDKNDGNVIYRGCYDIFGSNEVSKDSLVSLENKKKLDSDVHIERLKDCGDVIFLSACRSYQKNMETVKEGKGYGSLSYAMYLASANVGFSNIGKWIENVKEMMGEIVYTQVPQVRSSLDLGGSSSQSQNSLNPDENKDDLSLYLYITILLVLTIIVSIILWKKK